MKEQSGLYVGLMSGTSVDAIDAALVNLSSAGADLLETHEHAIPDALKQQIAAISHPGDNEIQRLGELDRELGQLFAAAVEALLQKSGKQASDVVAIGSHGQTIRHQPPSMALSGSPFTLQIADPNTIAEVTGITTVADFRRRDIAAGGEGAPLAPAFHRAVFSKTGVNRAIVNIGGIANASLLEGDTLACGFDTGPGNTLLDQWYRRHHSGNYDEGGHWAAQGSVTPPLLDALLQHPYFSLSGPRSTGKESFNPGWLQTVLEPLPDIQAVDIQATLLDFTALSITRGIERETVTPSEVYVCGGGAHNEQLLKRLARLLAPASVAVTTELGIHPEWVEAVAFAWLAFEALGGRAGNAPQVTGAKGARVLGAMYQA